LGSGTWLVKLKKFLVSWLNAPLVLVCGLFLLFNAQLVLMRGLDLGSDGALLFYPTEWALARALHAGSLPFWVPELGGGYPLLADGLSGALYPPNLLAFAALPVPLAHNLLVVGHGLLGLVFMAAWGRRLGLGTGAAALAGWVFALTTPLIGQNMPMLEALAWTPLVFLITENGVRERSPRGLWPLGGVAALQWLAGFPQITLYGLLAAGVYLVGRLWVERVGWRVGGRLLAGWCAAVFLGTALAAPQLLPTWELAQASVRAGGNAGSLAGERSLFPAALVTYVVPSLGEFFSGSGLGEGFFVGALPFVLALAVIFSGERRTFALPLAGMIGVMAALAFGRFSPLFPLVSHVPGLASFRVAARFMIPAQLGLATLFGFGWEALNGAPAPRLEKWLVRFLRFTVLILMGVTLAGYPLLRALQPQLIGLGEQFVARYILGDANHLQSAAYYTVKIAALYALLLDALRFSHPGIWATLGAALLGWAAWRYQPARAGKIWAGLILIELLISQGGMRGVDPLGWVTDPPETAALVKGSVPAGLCRAFWLVDEQGVTFAPEDLALLPANFAMIHGVASTGIYSPLAPAAYHRLLEPLGTVNLAFGLRAIDPEAVVANRALLDLLNVCTLLSRQPLTGFPLAGEAAGVFVYQNDTALPRAFAVAQVEVVPSTEAALAWLAANPEKLRDTVVVEAPPPAPLARAAEAEITVISYTPTRVQIEIAAPGSVLLVFTDSFAPGWRAALDAAPAPLHRVDAVFRGVYIPAGEHLVTFEYQPRAYWLGLGVAAGALMGLFVWMKLSRFSLGGRI